MLDLTAVVLAAGQGKRMRSRLAKVLHPIAGRPLLYYPVRAALEAGAAEVVVVTSPGTREAVQEALREALPAAKLKLVVQDPPRGTGDATLVGLRAVLTERVMVLCGDTPLIQSVDLSSVHEALNHDPSLELTLMTCNLENPAGYGRVLRDDQGRPALIREERDLRSEAERRVHEVNAGVYAARTETLREALSKIEPNNAQGEYYLTDVVALAAENKAVASVLGSPEALIGVNDRSQLAVAEAALYQRIAERHRLAGVTLRGTPQIDDAVEIGLDVTIEANVSLRGATCIAAGARIDVGCVITNSEIGVEAEIRPYCVVTESRIGGGAVVGPFAHLRTGSHLDERSKVGNFVETKKTRLRRGAKANHLAYLGDGDVGEGANIGAGTIFCNYDGYRKHQTTIGAGAFIGSDSQIIAPVNIGEDAYVATGTTVSRDVPADGLAISRVKQQNKEGYAPRLKARLSAAARRDSFRPAPPSSKKS